MHRKTARYRAPGLGYFTGIGIQDLNQYRSSMILPYFVSLRLFAMLTTKTPRRKAQVLACRVGAGVTLLSSRTESNANADLARADSLARACDSRNTCCLVRGKADHVSSACPALQPGSQCADRARSASGRSRLCSGPESRRVHRAH